MRLRFLLPLLLIALSASAGNLVPNSGFEIGLRRGWVYESATGSFPLDSSAESLAPWECITNGYAGSNSMRMPEGGYFFSRPIYLTNGDHKASFYVKGDNAKANEFKWGLPPHYVINSTNILFFITNAPSVTTSWTRESATVSVPTNGFYCLAWWWWQNATGNFKPAIDNVQLEPGTSLTAYAPQSPIDAGIVVTNYAGAYLTDETKTLGVRFHNSTANASNVVYEVRFVDDFNRTLQTTSGTANATPGLSTVTVNLPAIKGWLRVLLRTDIPEVDDETSIDIPPFASTYAALTGTNSILGQHVHGSAYHAKMAARLNPWSRSLMAKYQMRWTVIEATSNTWTWTDSQISQQATNGLTIFGCLHAGLDGQYPSWATNASGQMSEDLWLRYASNVVRRYGESGTGEINHWEVLNEPNQYTLARHAGNYDNPSNYARLLERTIEVITNLSPSAYIVGLAGIGNGGSYDYGSNVLYYMSAFPKARMNSVSYHIYPGTNPPNTDDRSDDHWRWYSEWRSVIYPQKEMWNTESGIWMGPGTKGRNTLFPGVYNLQAASSPEVSRSAIEYRTRMVIDTASKSLLRTIGWGFTKYWAYDSRAFRTDNQTSSSNGSEAWDDTLQPNYAVQLSAAYMLDNGLGLGPVTNVNSSGLEAYWYCGRDGRAIVATWSADMQLRTLTTTNSFFAVYDVWGNLVQTNSSTISIARAPVFLVSSTLTTNSLKDIYRVATVATPADVSAPNVVIDVAPSGSYEGGFHLAKWSAVDDVWVPYEGSAAQETNILYRWKLDAGSYSAYSQSNHVWLAPSAGDHTLYVSAIDTNGNAAEWSYQFIPTSDTDSPTVTITSPTSSSTYSTDSSTIDLAGTSSDNNAVVSVSWSNSRGGAGSATGTTSWSKTGITLYSGGNVLTVTATDAAGNSGTDTVTVTYIPPAVGGGVNNVGTLNIY